MDNIHSEFLLCLAEKWFGTFLSRGADILPVFAYDPNWPTCATCHAWGTFIDIAAPYRHNPGGVVAYAVTADKLRRRLKKLGW